MKRSPMPRRPHPLPRRGPLRSKKRKAAETTRAHGSPEKRAWMKRQPCIICGRTPSDAAHLHSGGTGRKDNHERTVPLCSDSVGYSGHHTEYDGGKRSFVAKYGVDLPALAAHTQRRFEAESSGLTPLSSIVPRVVQAMGGGEE